MTLDGSECASFWDYVDGDLDEPRSETYRKHMVSCSACRLNLEEYSIIADSLQWGGEEEPPEDLRPMLLKEFRRTHPTPDRGKRFFSWMSILGRPVRLPVWGAATVLLAVLGLIYLADDDRGRKGNAVPIPSREEVVAYQVYGSDGTLKAAVRTTIQKGSAR